MTTKSTAQDAPTEARECPTCHQRLTLYVRTGYREATYECAAARTVALGIKPLTDLLASWQETLDACNRNDDGELGMSVAYSNCIYELRATIAQLKPITPREAGILAAANRLSAAQAARTAYGRAAHYDPDECDKISWETQSAHKALMAALADDTAQGVK